MDDMIEYISKISADQLPELLMAVIERYHEAFPDCDISTVSIHKDGTAYEQISRMIELMERLREYYKGK